MIEYEICSYCCSVTERWYVDEDGEICCPDCNEMFKMYEENDYE